MALQALTGQSRNVRPGAQNQAMRDIETLSALGLIDGPDAPDNRRPAAGRGKGAGPAGARGAGARGAGARGQGARGPAARNRAARARGGEQEAAPKPAPKAAPKPAGGPRPRNQGPRSRRNRNRKQ